MSVTPNMNLQLPSPTVTEGPEWATELNSALEVVDDHDHTSAKGKRIPTSGIDINQDLSANGYRHTDVGAVKFDEQAPALSGALNAGSISVTDGDLYFTNSGGVSVQITDGNTIVSNVVIPSSPLMPSGTVLDFAGTSVPVGFLECDGSVVSQSTYSDLFAAIGSSFNTGGEGVGNFRLPDFKGRVAVGKGTYTDSVMGSITRTIGQLIGAAAHVLTTGEMPSHTHNDSTGHYHRYRMFPVQAGPNNAGLDLGTVNDGGQIQTATVTLDNTGGGSSHNNMQPSIVVMKIIKT